MAVGGSRHASPQGPRRGGLFVRSRPPRLLHNIGLEGFVPVRGKHTGTQYPSTACGELVCARMAFASRFGTDGDAARYALERSRSFHAGEIACELRTVV